ncbi:hypothetical protein [Microbacterium sp. NPDC096154]|uniref:hypothetical protein n=1 Tax=Microbacterium sp. NPDC096154 TaxID=3155549 RepID=UPI00332D2D77
MSAPATLLLLAACFAGLAGVCWILAVAIERVRRGRWVRTEGEWAECETRLARVWQVGYVVEGQPYRVMPLLNAGPLRPDHPVVVSYSPLNPRRAVIDTRYHRSGAVILAGISSAGTALVLALGACAVAVSA